MTEHEHEHEIVERHLRRRRRTGLRSLGIASAAAFAGGVAVVGVQFAVSLVSAGYPAVVEALTCGPVGDQPRSAVPDSDDATTTVPVMQVTVGSVTECRMDAPGADYAIWRITGPVFTMHSGPLDPALPCQTKDDFARQEAERLRLATCLRLLAERPGLYLVTVQVMARGQPTVDRAAIAVRVVPAAPVEVPAPAAPVTRLAATLHLPERRVERTEEADLSASFSEHGVLPQSRGFLRTVYRLQPNEEFVSAAFRARSAAQASNVRISYDPRSRAVTAGFTLRSGPLYDRWRGWVSGTVVIQLRQQEPARDIALPAASLAVPGQARIALPEDVALDGASFRLQRPETGAMVELQPGGLAVLDDTPVSARVDGTTLVLETVRR